MALAQLGGTGEIGGFGGFSTGTCSGVPHEIGSHQTVAITCGDGPTVGVWGGYDINRRIGVEGAFATPWNRHSSTLRYYGSTLMDVSSDPLICGRGSGCLPVDRARGALRVTGFRIHVVPGPQNGSCQRWRRGAKLVAGSHVLFRLEVRRHWMTTRPVSTVEEKFNTTDFTAGFAYHRAALMAACDVRCACRRATVLPRRQARVVANVHHCGVKRCERAFLYQLVHPLRGYYLHPWRSEARSSGGWRV